MKWLALLLVLAGQAQADAAGELRASLGELKAATGLLAKGKQSRQAIGEAVKAHERALGAIRAALRATHGEEARLIRVFEDSEGQLSKLLGVLTALGQGGGPVVFLHPGGPVAAARAAQLLDIMTPALVEETDILRHDLKRLAAIRAAQSDAETGLREGLVSLQGARAALERFGKSDPADRSALAKGVASLEEAIAASAALSAGDAAPKALKGQLALPVEGEIVRTYGQQDAAGIARSGMTLAAAPASLVTAPAHATVRHVGTLPGYGNVILLEPAPDLILVLAGMAETLVRTGEIVDAGEAIGMLGGLQPDADTFLISARDEGGASSLQTLYIEVRRAGTPADPAEWFGN